MAFNALICTNSRLLSSHLWSFAAEFYPNLVKSLVNRAGFSVKCAFPFIWLTTSKIVQRPKKKIRYTEFYLNRTKNVQNGTNFNLDLKKNAAFAVTILTKLTNAAHLYVKILYTEFYPNW